MEVEQFYGVYMLVSINPKFKGRIYIGFTVDPNRRIKQHNTGLKAGGAYKTSKYGPWTMVLIVHGFPNEISALRFEWAWQHPSKSRRLRHLPKKCRQSFFQFHMAILTEMLRIGPWNRLPLTIRWLSIEHKVEFDPFKSPPIHMPITEGPVECVKTKPSEQDKSLNRKCFICQKDVTKEHQFKCLIVSCEAVFHILCLNLHNKLKCLKEVDQLIPVMTHCPKCDQELLWGELVRYKNGCYQNVLCE